MQERTKLIAQMAATIAAGLYAASDEAEFDAEFVVKKAARILEVAEGREPPPGRWGTSQATL